MHGQAGIAEGPRDRAARTGRSRPASSSSRAPGHARRARAGAPRRGARALACGKARETRPCRLRSGTGLQTGEASPDQAPFGTFEFIRLARRFGRAPQAPNASASAMSGVAPDSIAALCCGVRGSRRAKKRAVSRLAFERPAAMGRPPPVDGARPPVGERDVAGIEQVVEAAAPISSAFASASC